MNRCPNCTYENLPTSTFCERCGASLASISSPLEPTQRPLGETAIPPPPPGFEAMPTLFSPHRRQYRRTVGGTIHSLLWYLWSIACFCLGLAGGILNDPTGSGVNGLIIILCFLAGLVILIPLLLYRKHFVLRGRERLLLEIGLAVLGFIVLIGIAIIQAASHFSTRTYDQAFGIVFVAYGLAAAFVAFW